MVEWAPKSYPNYEGPILRFAARMVHSGPKRMQFQRLDR